MQASSTKNVHITSDKGQVDDSLVTVRKGRAEQVTWFAYGTKGATIQFSAGDGCPFQERVFYVPSTGRVITRPPQTNVVNKTYKYTVVWASGSSDPRASIGD